MKYYNDYSQFLNEAKNYQEEAQKAIVFFNKAKKMEEEKPGRNRTIVNLRKGLRKIEEVMQTGLREVSNRDMLSDNIMNAYELASPLIKKYQDKLEKRDEVKKRIELFNAYANEIMNNEDTPEEEVNSEEEETEETPKEETSEKEVSDEEKKDEKSNKKGERLEAIKSNYSTIINKIKEEKKAPLLVVNPSVKSDYVQLIQGILNDYLDIKTSVDGYYGSKTAASVTQLQKKLKEQDEDILVDGKVGEQTWAAMLEPFEISDIEVTASLKDDTKSKVSSAKDVAEKEESSEDKEETDEKEDKTSTDTEKKPTDKERGDIEITEDSLSKVDMSKFKALKGKTLYTNRKGEEVKGSEIEKRFKNVVRGLDEVIKLLNIGTGDDKRVIDKISNEELVAIMKAYQDKTKRDFAESLTDSSLDVYKDVIVDKLLAVKNPAIDAQFLYYGMLGIGTSSEVRKIVDLRKDESLKYKKMIEANFNRIRNKGDKAKDDSLYTWLSDETIVSRQGAVKIAMPTEKEYEELKN